MTSEAMVQELRVTRVHCEVPLVIRKLDGIFRPLTLFSLTVEKCDYKIHEIRQVVQELLREFREVDSDLILWPASE
jgi:hypothetical protein